MATGKVERAVTELPVSSVQTSRIQDHHWMLPEQAYNLMFHLKSIFIMKGYLTHLGKDIYIYIFFC